MGLHARQVCVSNARLALLVAALAPPVDQHRPGGADGTARGVHDERLARVNVSAEVLTDVQRAQDVPQRTRRAGRCVLPTGLAGNVAVSTDPVAEVLPIVAAETPFGVGEEALGRLVVATHDTSPLMVWCSTNPSEHSWHVEDDSYRHCSLFTQTSSPRHSRGTTCLLQKGQHRLFGPE